MEKAGCCHHSLGAAPAYLGLLAVGDSSLSTWGSANIRPPGGLIWTPLLKLLAAELHKAVLGSKYSTDAGDLYVVLHALFALLNALQPVLRSVLSLPPI